MDFDVIAQGLQFPEGPIAMNDGSVILVEIARGTLTRAWNGRTEVIAHLGGGPNGAAIGPDGAVYVCNNGGFEWRQWKGMLVPSGAARKLGRNLGRRCLTGTPSALPEGPSARCGGRFGTALDGNGRPAPNGACQRELGAALSAHTVLAPTRRSLGDSPTRRPTSQRLGRTPPDGDNRCRVAALAPRPR